MVPNVEKRDGQKFVSGFARGLSVIQAFGPERRSMNVAEVASVTKLDRAVARRLLHTLVELGFATVNKKQFELTSSVLRLGYTYLASLGLDGSLQPHLNRLSKLTGETVSISVLNGTDVIFVARSEAQGSTIAYVVRTGLKLPAFSSSSGRVLLSAMPDVEVKALLQKTRIEARTPKTITDRKRILEIIRKARETGYATNDQELELELFAISVAMRNQAGKITASLNLNSPAARVTARRISQELLPALRESAQSISSILL
jgi:IclR family pca regulon transcriptional regulator